jgi:hypothetical protein
MILTLLIISWIWATLEGRREAQYFHYKFSQPNPTTVRDEHLEFTLQRGLFALSTTIPLWLTAGWLTAIAYILCVMLSFPFFHDGMYYLRRNQLDNSIYQKCWMDSSSSTTAKFSIKFAWRLTLFCCAVLLSILIFILK